MQLHKAQQGMARDAAFEAWRLKKKEEHGFKFVTMVEEAARQQESEIPLGTAMFKAKVQALEAAFVADARKKRAASRNQPRPGKWQRTRAQDYFDDDEDGPPRKRTKNQRRNDRRRKNRAKLRAQAQAKGDKGAQGKAKDKDAGKTCFKCGKAGHIAANCKAS